MRFEENGNVSILVANEDGTGERLLATRNGSKEWFESTPAWSPDGKSLACSAGTYAGGLHSSLLIINVADGTQKEIGAAKWFYGRSVVWLHDGSGLLVSAPENTTAPVQVWYVSYPGGAAHRITNDLNDYNLASATADSKTLLAVQEKRLTDVWVTPTGGDVSQPPKQVTFTKSDGWFGITWTPDGKIVLTAITGGVWDLWVMNADGSNRRQITSGTSDKGSPAVSPDGRFLVFASGDAHIWRVDLDGSNLKQLTFSDSEEHSPHITPDGKWVIFSSWRTGKLTPWKVPADGGEPVQLSDKQLRCTDVSPDGKLIVCADVFQQQGKWKIVLLPIAGGEPAKVIEPPDNYSPGLGWTADGSAITLLHSQGGTDNIWKLPLDGSPPKQLTNFNDTSLQNISRYALARDGKRFAVVRSNSTSDLVLISDFK